MAWDVKLAKSATRELDKLPSAAWPRVERAIDELALDPNRGDVRPLHGPEWGDCLRKRVGAYRIIFTIDHAASEVTVLAILRRSEKTYR